MPRRLIDLTGRAFGRLTVISRKPSKGESLWACACSCGRERLVRGFNLRSGCTQSCGCLKSEVTATRNTTHGLGKPPEYGVWTRMRNRCENTRSPDYPDYGGRGITVCERWSEFKNFLADMGKRPTGKSIDRINNDGNYEPGNCRWATPTQQANNTRRSRRYEWRGQALSISEIAAMEGKDYVALRGRIDRGWDMRRALTEPAFNRGQRA